MLRFISNGSSIFQPFRHTPFIKALQVFTPTTYSTNVLAEVEVEQQELRNKWKDATEVLSKWGCSDDDLMRIFARCPALRNADPTQVQSKLCLLSDLGFGASELVKITNCRPRFFRTRISDSFFDKRLASLMSLFESKEMLQKAIVRNPSLICENGYDIEATVALYEELGVSKRDLVQMLLLRPTILARTSFDAEKLEYISMTGLSKESKLYKYVVTLIGISRVETIREKVSKFTQFGFSKDEVFGLVGRQPHVLTFSTDKVQRNMTFVLGTMKLEAKIILKYPYLLYANVDTVLKPRLLLAWKVEEICPNLQIKGVPTIVRALRMTEERFLNSFIKCQPKEIANELMEFYERTKETRRLAESAKKCITRGFPF
ncbi:uncharacterized protein LOC130749727 [Lotus japonicus]|uniref:uncharacterized protein LOC130749727 n=1 Tax=Lotus japonicus TaxID=34305 RepID=UPI0025831C56|nr:uncharacterized protein LOC130749727 [Lotus japonicus]